MSFSIFNRIAAPVVLSAVGIALGAASDGASSYIGPKGGDTRKVVPIAEQYHQPVQSFVVEGEGRPFATAKGNYGLGKGFQGTGYSPAAWSDHATVAQDHGQLIGPKGGDTRHGL